MLTDRHVDVDLAALGAAVSDGVAALDTVPVGNDRKVWVARMPSEQVRPPAGVRGSDRTRHPCCVGAGLLAGGGVSAASGAC